eukprot:scaffold1605_cov158-Amphora_coffeaeformis.AAC.3
MGMFLQFGCTIVLLSVNSFSFPTTTTARSEQKKRTRRIGTSTPWHASSDVSDPSSANKDNDNVSNNNNDIPDQTIVIVGGGWAGFSAADALTRAATCDDNNKNGRRRVKIHLLDASPRGPGGLNRAWRTPVLGRSVEAGIHGMWRDYTNTMDAMERCIGLEIQDVLTPYLPSILVSSEGRVAVAPVLAGNEHDNKDSSPPLPLPAPWRDVPFVSELVQNLPPPLDVALLTEFQDPSRLSVLDRISGLGLLGAWADFGQEHRDSWLRYDNVSADNLFRRIAAVSPALYTELVAPLLHVLPMTPAYDCSAAAALSCFHVFALQSRGAFDVRWCRGSIGEKVFDAWVKKLPDSVVSVQGGTKVTHLEKRQDDSKYIVTLNDDESNRITADAVVLAVGAVSAGRLAATCPALKPWEKDWSQLRGITCVAVRLFVKELPMAARNAMKESPVVVCGPDLLKKSRHPRAALLVETGFCLYDLSRIQDEFISDKDELAVLEVDFFRADTLADLDDDDVVDLTMHAMAAALQVDTKRFIQSIDLIDQSVVRARKAVSHFCPGSAAVSPPTKLADGLYMCGDWVDRTGHASWSTEKAVVTGRQAALQCANDLNLDTAAVPAVLPTAPDTPALQALRQTARLWRTINPMAKFPHAPWAR